MSSLAQVEANRQNSQRSTGPTSSAGKAVSRFNAVKSGIYTKCLVIPGEDPAEFESMAANYQQQYQPATQTEQYLVDFLIANDWRLRRYRNAETRLWALNPDPAFALAENIALVRLYRLITTTSRDYSTALKELERQIAGRTGTEPVQDEETLPPASPEPEAEQVAPAPAQELASFRPMPNSVPPASAAGAQSRPQPAPAAYPARREETKTNLALRL